MTTSAGMEQRIARTALRILEKEGQEAVSMRRVARAIGITPMAIYHHFDSREALLESVVTREFHQFLELIGKLPAFESVEDQIIHTMDAYLEYAFTRPHIFDYVFSRPRADARRFPEDFRARLSPTLNPLADAVSSWMEQGHIKPDDVWEITLQLWASAHGYVVLYRGGRINLSQDGLKELVHRSLRRLLHGLRP